MLASRAALVSILSILIHVVACGSGPGSPETRFRFSDGKGRSCTQAKFGLTAVCDATPSPRQACPEGQEACFVVYVPEADAGPELATGTMWNCDACCAGAASRWSGNTSDCAPVVCTTDADCTSEDGRCEGGRCRSSR